MTKEELAKKCNGCAIGEEITQYEESCAKKEGLLVIFGASDDLVELRGAINDEVGAWQGCEILIDKAGNLLPVIEDDEAEILKKHKVLTAAIEARADATKVTAHWCQTKEFSWTFETTAPHATFDIMEDGEGYCRGIVLDLKELE